MMSSCAMMPLDKIKMPLLITICWPYLGRLHFVKNINENSVLMDDLDLSSMEILTVVADLEETFGLRIPEKELRNFVTVSDLADYLAAHAGE